MADPSAPHAATLRRHHKAGVAAHPRVPLGFALFSQHLLAKTRAWCAPGPEAAERALARLAGADVFLAIACDTETALAWERLRVAYVRRLVGLAVGRGSPPHTAADLVDDLMSDLALPPPRGGARSRLGTYTGRGSLFAFLATLLSRRRADAARQRVRHRRDPRSVEDAAAHLAMEQGEPLHALVQGEFHVDVEAALAAGLARCTPRERLVLALKYRDGMQQQEIAALLGIGAPRVSRLAAQATERLQRYVVDALGTPADAEANWERLCQVVRQALATHGGLERPSSGSRSRSAEQ